MTLDGSGQANSGLLANELTRRNLLARSGILMAAGAMALPADAAIVPSNDEG